MSKEQSSSVNDSQHTNSSDNFYRTGIANARSRIENRIIGNLNQGVLGHRTRTCGSKGNVLEPLDDGNLLNQTMLLREQQPLQMYKLRHFTSDPIKIPKMGGSTQSPKELSEISASQTSNTLHAPSMTQVENSYESAIFATWNKMKSDQEEQLRKNNQDYRDQRQRIEELCEKQIQEEQHNMQRKLHEAQEKKLKEEQQLELERQIIIQRNLQRAQRKKFVEEKKKLRIKQEKEQERLLKNKFNIDEESLNTFADDIEKNKKSNSKSKSRPDSQSLALKHQQNLLKEQELEHKKQLSELQNNQLHEEEKQQLELLKETEYKQQQQKEDLHRQQEDHQQQNLKQRIINEQQNETRALLRNRERNNRTQNEMLIPGAVFNGSCTRLNKSHQKSLVPGIQGSCSVTYLNRLTNTDSNLSINRKLKSIGLY